MHARQSKKKALEFAIDRTRVKLAHLVAVRLLVDGRERMAATEDRPA